MATQKETVLLEVVANDVKHIIQEIGAVRAKVTEMNGGLRNAQRDVAVIQAQNQQHCKCIEDLYEKYKEVKNSTWGFIKIGATIGFVTTVLVGGSVVFILRLVGLI